MKLALTGFEPRIGFIYYKHFALPPDHFAIPMAILGGAQGL